MFSKVKKTTDMPSIVSVGLRIVGNLQSSGDIQVDGMVEGEVRSHMLTVGDSGVINGSIHADIVRIAGTVNGEITARVVGTLKTARITADINHESLSMEAGTYLQGQCRRLDAQSLRSAPSAAEVEIPKPSLQIAEVSRAKLPIR